MSPGVISELALSQRALKVARKHLLQAYELPGRSPEEGARLLTLRTSVIELERALFHYVLREPHQVQGLLV